MNNKNELIGSLSSFILDRPANKKVSLFFKCHRKKAALTQKEVSEYLGFTSSQFISNWERGECQLPQEYLKKIVSLYKIDKNEVFNIYLTNTRESIERWIISDQKVENKPVMQPAE